MNEYERRKAEAQARRLLEQRMYEPLSRRQFVRRVGGAFVVTSLGASFLAACGGGDDGGEAGGTTGGGAGGDVGGTLNMVIWDGYDDKDAQAPFTKKNSVKTQATYIGNNEEIFTKLRAGGTGQVDLVTPYHGYIGVLVESDLLEPLDYERIPNTADYISNFDKPDWVMFDDKPYGAPYIWGTDPMMWNAKVIKEEPTSWRDVEKPQYKGKVVMVDDTLGQIMVWAKVLGHDPPTELSQEALDEVIDFLVKLKKKQARAFASGWGDMADIMARGDAWISTGGWEAISMFAEQKGGDVRFVHPEEGDFAWTDSWCIPKDAPNIDTAYAYADHMISPEAQAIVAKDLASGVVNEKAIDLLDEETAKIYPYDDLESVFEKAPNYDIPPREPTEGLTTLDDWNKAWERLRAA
ncbi:MAG: extracellular solute-binding protein [Thermoleophilia bacterium]|nr:extracellular solute-binding protein [Thermoleophilia bacterium]